MKNNLLINIRTIIILILLSPIFLILFLYMVVVTFVEWLVNDYSLKETIIENFCSCHTKWKTQHGIK